MKTGINGWFGYIIEPNEKFKMIKQAGFDHMLLWWGNEFEHQNEKKNAFLSWLETQGYMLKISMSRFRVPILYGKTHRILKMRCLNI